MELPKSPDRKVEDILRADRDCEMQEQSEYLKSLKEVNIVHCVCCGNNRPEEEFHVVKDSENGRCLGCFDKCRTKPADNFGEGMTKCNKNCMNK